MEAFDWNCSQDITPRFTERIQEAVARVETRLRQLEEDNERFRSELARLPGRGEDEVTGSAQMMNCGIPLAAIMSASVCGRLAATNSST